MVNSLVSTYVHQHYVIVNGEFFGVNLCTSTLFLLLHKYVNCTFPLKYLAAVCAGISDYVMEKLFCGVLATYICKTYSWFCDVVKLCTQLPRNAVVVYINGYLHAPTVNYKSMQVFNSAPNSIKNIAIFCLVTNV